MFCIISHQATKITLNLWKMNLTTEKFTRMESIEMKKETERALMVKTGYTKKERKVIERKFQPSNVINVVTPNIKMGLPISF